MFTLSNIGEGPCEPVQGLAQGLLNGNSVRSGPPAVRSSGCRDAHDNFFELKWAYWLQELIPGAAKVVEIDGARLFFPDERSVELTAALREFWRGWAG